MTEIIANISISLIIVMNRGGEWMSITRPISELVQKQIRIVRANGGMWTEELSDCYLEEVDLLMQDIDESIRFLKEDCTSEEGGYLSELLPELTKRTKDDRFLNCFKYLECRYRNEEHWYYITDHITVSTPCVIHSLPGALNPAFSLLC